MAFSLRANEEVFLNTIEICYDATNPDLNSKVLTPFDNGDGKVYLVSTDDCLDEQVATLKKNVLTVKDWHAIRDSAEKGDKTWKDFRDEEKVLEQVYKREKFFEYYATGETVVLSWQWADAEVADGDTVGACIAPDTEGAYASCWTFTRDDTADNGYYQFPNSYLFPANLITGENPDIETIASADESYTIDGSMFPSMFGSW